MDFKQLPDNILGIISNFFHSESSHSHEHCEILLVVEGTIVLECKDNLFKLSRKSFIIIPPGIQHAIIKNSIESPVVVDLFFPYSAFEAVFSIMKNEDTVTEIFAGNTPSAFVMTEKAFNDILPKIRSLRLNNTNSIFIMQIFFQLLEAAVEEINNDFNTDKLPQTLKKALDSMHDMEKMCEGVAALKKMSGYSYSRLNSLMNKYLGTTPHGYVTKLRMEKAKDMLINSEKTLITIALDIGYSTESHFINTFKKYYGTTPSKIRKDN